MITNEQRRVWIEALRSGKYKQGQRALKNGDKYCCLGVLQELFNVPNFSTKSEYLNTTFITIEEQGLLAVMNDGGKPFYDIANVIEGLLT